MFKHFWSFFVVALAGWMNRQQEEVIEYLKEENRVLRERLGPKRLILTIPQRRRLATAAAAAESTAAAGMRQLILAGDAAAPAPHARGSKVRRHPRPSPRASSEQSQYGP
jgi:hypothetical protein